MPNSATPLLVGGSPPGSPRAGKGRAKPLTMLPLVVLIFFEVSGGPFGTEDAVTAGGPLLTVLGFLILPLLWSLPEALVTAELATTFPENSGYVAWVTAAFGPFWGFQEGLWSWLSGVTDNSLYPVMFAANLELFFPQLASGYPRMYFLVGLSLFLSYLNYRGLTVVGHAIVTSIIAILVPFLLLILLAIPHIKPTNWLIVDWPTVDWATYINVMFWNLNYWDSVSTLAGEVDNPGHTFPRALMMAVLLVVAAYLLPTLAALGITVNDADWSLGCYGKVAQQVGGQWLAIWIIVAAGCSQVAQYQAEMASDSYQLQGMAERGFLPKVLAGRSKHDTPTMAIILSSLGVLSLTTFNFIEIVTLLNAVYCLAELLEFAAYIWLRIKAPDLHRPYKVPLPTWALVLMLLPATLLLLAVLAIPVVKGDYKTVYWTMGAMVMGFVMHPMLQLARRRGWCEFAPVHFEVAGIYGPAPPTASCSVRQSLDVGALGALNGENGGGGGVEGGDEGEGGFEGEGDFEEPLAPSLIHQNMRVEAVVPGMHTAHSSELGAISRDISDLGAADGSAADLTQPLLSVCDADEEEGGEAAAGSTEENGQL